MQNRDADIHIAVTPDRKRRWEEYVEEDPDVSSLTELVRTGVTEMIERRESVGTGEEFEIDWEPVLQPMHEMQGDMEQVLERISQVYDEVEGRDEISELAEYIYPLLPEAERPADLDEARRELNEAASIRDKAMATGAANYYADLYNTDIPTVIDAMVELSAQHQDIRLNDEGGIFEAFKVPNGEANDA